MISVLMSVYNGKLFLKEAVESILNQSFTDFEFIIFDDCSIDDSAQLLQKYVKTDKRIKLITNKHNIGLGANLRQGVEIASGKWIARMDADDIALPHRLQTQIDYVTAHPNTDILGSYAFDIDNQGNTISLRKCPIDHKRIIKYIWTCPIIHPTAFMKKESLIKAGSYGQEKRRQDYALWFRCAKNGLIFANIPEPLIKYRFTEDYFKRNNISALLDQVKIGLSGCLLVKAAPIGVTVPLIKAILPKPLKMLASNILKKFDPRAQ